MKLKYYMRGVGTGIIFTVLIFLVIILPHERADKEADVRAEYEQAEADTQSGLSQILSPAGSDEAEPSSEPQETVTPEVTEAPSEQEAPEVTDAPEEGSEDVKDTPEITEEPSETQDEPEDTEEPSDTEDEPQDAEGPADDQDTSEKPVEDQSGDAEYIIIGISRGMTSEQFSEKAENIGLVDDAAEFNRFIITNGYADDISVGNFSIRKGSSYREIAKIVTDASNSID